MDSEAVAHTIDLGNKVPILPLRQMKVQLLGSEIGLPVALALRAVMHGTITRSSGESPSDLPGLVGLAENCENPLLQAVAAEACWHLRIGGQPHRFALAAIRGYRGLASEPAWLLSDHAEVLVHALTMAIDLNNEAEVLHIARDLASFLNEAVEMAPGRDSRALCRLHFQLVMDDAPEAGEALAEQQFHDAGLFVLRALAQHRQSSILRDQLAWDEIERCAVSAFDEAEGDRSLRAALLKPVTIIQRDPVVRRAIIERHLRAEAAWVGMQEAGPHYGILVKAELAARDAGLRGLAVDLQRRIQGIDRKDILSPVRAEVTVPRMLVDGVLQDFMGQVFAGDDWRRWARNLVLVGGCPIGATDSCTDPNERSTFARPVRSAFRGLSVGPKSVPTRAVRSGENEPSQPTRQATQFTQGQAQLYAAVLLMPAVSEFLRRLADVSAEDVTAFLVSHGLDGVRAGHVVGALRLYDAGDFDGAAHRLLPRVEYLLRERACPHGSVIRPTDGTSRGGVDTLGAVLATLEGHLDENWRRYLQFVLVEDRGLNLRNDLLHSLRVEATESDAAILVHVFLACCFLDDVADAPGAEGTGESD